MKRLIFVCTIISLLLTFTACKKVVVSLYFMEDIANILINADDCDKAATDIKDYVNANGDKWKEYVLAQLKTELDAERSKGKKLDQSDTKRILKSLYFPTDRSLEKKMDNSNCAIERKEIADVIDSIRISVRDASRNL